MVSRLILWFGLLYAIASSFPATATAAVVESPRFRVLGVTDGLPASIINVLVRDRAGYLWIGTPDGLARYDGVGFRIWRHVPGDPQSLPRNAVQALYVDAADRLWIATESGGLSVLDADRRHMRHYTRATYPQIGSDDTFAIAGRNGDLWFGTYPGGLHRLDARGRITRFVHDANNPRSLPGDNVMSLAFDDAGTLWIATTDGLARWTRRDGIERVALPGPEPATMLYTLGAEGNRVWVGARTGVFIREADGRWTVPPWSAGFESPNSMTAFAADAGGRYWIASQRMLARATRDGDARPMQLDPGAAVTARSIPAVLAQPDGALWVPIPGKGLGFLPSQWRRIATIAKSDPGLSGDQYRYLAPSSRGGFWLAGATAMVEHIAPATAAVERVSLPGDTRSMCVVEDRASLLWVCTRNALMRVDPRSGAVRQWTRDSGDPILDAPMNLARIAPDGSVWVSWLGAGLQRRDPVSGRVLESILAGDGKGLQAADTEWIDFASDGELWVAGDQGLLRRDGNGKLVPVAGVGDERVYSFAFDGANRLWVHRLSGLERYRRQADGWRREARFALREGIPAVESMGMSIDAAGRVWLPTPRGLFRVDPAARRVRAFGVRNGLDNQEFNDRAIARTADGVLGLATADGAVVLVDTAMRDVVPQPSNLLIDSIGVLRGDRSLVLPARGGFQLQSDDHELRVAARLLAYDDPLANRYWSKLEGFDRVWVAQGANGERVFAALPAGEYRLRIRAVDAAGRPAQEQRLRFSVLPPWWRTWWAMLAAVALSAALLGWLAHAYRQRLRRRHAWQLGEQKRELAEQASQAKTRFLATLGHEVRTPMTGVLGMSELLLDTTLDAKQRGYAQSIRRAGEHLMRLVNDALDLARIEAGRLELDLQPFDLHALLEDVIALTAPLAQQRGLAFQVHVLDDTPRWLHGDAIRVRQVLLNLLGNAIKFTEQGRVGLRIEALPQRGVRFIVSDTGPGLSEEHKHRLFRRFEQAEGARTAARYGGSGLGLAICQELAAAMGGRIEVDSTPGQGARFIVDLPLATAGVPDKPLPSRPRCRSRALDLLLVEDDPTVAEVIVGLLHAQGHRVTHVAHGLAALAEYAARRSDASGAARFDMALLDLDLPGIDGLALAQQLRAQGFAQPLLAVTARADADAEPQARAAGFDGFLRKPLTGEMLAEAMEGLLPVRNQS